MSSAATWSLAALVWGLALSRGAAAPADGQWGNVTLRVEIVPDAHRRHVSAGMAQTVAWLIPEGNDAARDPAVEPRTYRMVQKNKQFDPHLLVIPVGSLVEFPNLDPFFHNVFSLYNGKRFDLGLYETGSRRSVRFDREGVSYIFCNIHPEMGAVILALSTPYYAVSQEGAITIAHVPPGRYMLNVWSENATQESENTARRQVTISAEGASLGAVTLVAAPSPVRQHTNKFGQSYLPTPDPNKQGLPYP
jgi:plastocyanin